jgi:hypothetical protein
LYKNEPSPPGAGTYAKDESKSSGQDAAWLDEVTIAPGGGLAVVSSPDGVNWSLHPQAPYGVFDLAYGNGHFVLAGGQRILQSDSIINLSATRGIPTSPLTLSLEGPTGLDYTIQTSIDLISWRDVTKITSLQSTNVILDALPLTSANAFYRAISP